MARAHGLDLADFGQPRRDRQRMALHVQAAVRHGGPALLKALAAAYGVGTVTDARRVSTAYLKRFATWLRDPGPSKGKPPIPRPSELEGKKRQRSSMREKAFKRKRRRG